MLVWLQLAAVSGCWAGCSSLHAAVSTGDGQSVTPASARPVLGWGNVAQCAPAGGKLNGRLVARFGKATAMHFQPIPPRTFILHPDILNITRFQGNNFENICSHSADLAQQTSEVFQILCSI